MVKSIWVIFIINYINIYPDVIKPQVKCDSVMIEWPVKSPMVPPISPRAASVVTLISFSILKIKSKLKPTKLMTENHPKQKNSTLNLS